MNSFVYDFHVRQLSNFLESGSVTDYPGEEFLNTLQSIVMYFDPPRHARNAVRAASITAELGRSQLSPLEIFAFLARHASKYNFCSMAERGIFPAIFLVSSTPDLVNKSRDNQVPSNTVEEDTFCLVAFITDANYNVLNVDNVNLCAQMAWLKQHLATYTPQLASSTATAVSLAPCFSKSN